MTLRIAHIVRRFTFSEWGGTENVVWHTVLEQQKLGLEPEILCTSALDSPGTELREGIPIRRFPYRYPYFPMNADDRLALDKKGGNPLAPELMKFLQHGQYDLVHLHAGGRLALYAEQIARRSHIPAIMSLHGGSCAIPPREMALMLQPLRHKFSYGGLLDRIRRIGRSPEQQADVLLALSRQEVSLLQQKFPEKIIHLFPNGVSHRPLPPLDPGFRKKLGIPENDRIILCISRIDYQKNQKILVNLTSELRKTNHPCHLLLIGSISAQWYHEEILNLIRTLKMDSHATIIPGLPPDAPELLQALRQADCFILPSAHEPFGIAALEALDAQVPLLAAKTGGLTDFLHHGENALMFDHDNCRQLLDCWLSLQQNDRLRKQLIENGRQTAEKYCWPAIIRQLTDIYQEILHG